MQYHLVFSTDNNYIHYLFVLCQSIIDHLDNQYAIDKDELVFHVLTDQSVNLSEANAAVQGFTERNNQVCISYKFVWHVQDVKKFSSFTKMFREDKLAFSPYYRLLLDQILPTNIDYAAYLDVDMLVLTDIRELFNTYKLEGKVLGAVIDPGIFQNNIEDPQNILAYYKDDPSNFVKIPKNNYFNSGLLLINLNEWRKQNIGVKCLEYASKLDVICHDQDILNCVCLDKVELIDNAWNYHVLMFYLLYNPTSGQYDICHKCSNVQFPHSEYLSAERFERSSFYPKVVHFTNFKPWTSTNKGNSLIFSGPTCQLSHRLLHFVNLWLETEQKVKEYSGKIHLANSDSVNFNTSSFNKIFKNMNLERNRLLLATSFILIFSFINFIIHFFMDESLSIHISAAVICHEIFN